MGVEVSANGRPRLRDVYDHARDFLAELNSHWGQNGYVAAADGRTFTAACPSCKSKCHPEPSHRYPLVVQEADEPGRWVVIPWCHPHPCSEGAILVALRGRDIAALLAEVQTFIRRYVVMPGDHEATAVTLFVAHTHAIEAAHATPYPLVLSPEKQSGKTLLLEVLELLVRRPWRIVALSEAAMFRKIGRDQPTLLLDEIDAIFGSNSERTEPLRALLNAGNRPGASVARCVGANQDVVDFTVFCPKILAGIDTGRLPDTIRDRGIEIRMQRKTDAEPVERFQVRYVEPEAAELRNQLTDWAAGAVDALREAEPDLPDALSDRTAEGWEPMFAIADLAGGEWPARARAAAVALAERAEVEDATKGTRVLAVFAELLRERPAVSTEEVLDAINGDDELPFGGWRDGRGLDARGLAKLLKPYRVRPRTVKLPDGSTAKGYPRDHTMEEALTRYTLPEPSPASRPSPNGQVTAGEAALEAEGDAGDAGDGCSADGDVEGIE